MKVTQKSMYIFFLKRNLKISYIISGKYSYAESFGIAANLLITFDDAMFLRKFSTTKRTYNDFLKK